ncbi:dihydrouridine synthase-domain-containing protein [Ostreococcus tauri]|uniref:tRNA-dihydrouridine(47) synthase [NAD(P)(+)] n=1 Tax=Ostreococcus tauri TaxID=70448 RepID=A0A1Y5IIJ4_OSTTA|nr:dihydrouridine synthase-domain-containing protein [Ostreococcus tauri]
MSFARASPRRASTAVARRGGRDKKTSRATARAFDYDDAFARGRRRGGAPPTFVSPMEGLGDARFRIALHADGRGGFTEACKEFIRIPGTLPRGAVAEKIVKNLCARYDADELGNVPLGAQIMGSDAELLTLAARHLGEDKNAPRVDLNCGCPASVVTGKGAGSSLLKDPKFVYDAVSAVARGVEGTNAIVTMKLRTGYDDSGLLRENLCAARDAGARFISLHARTRAQGYSGRANWDDIAFAKEVLGDDVPIIGNGDVTSPLRCAELLRVSNADGVGIGRGAVQDPLIFRRIAATVKRDVNGVWRVTEDAFEREFEVDFVVTFLRTFAEEVFKTENKLNSKRGSGVQERELEAFKVGKLKSIVKYLFAGNDALKPHIQEVMRIDPLKMSAEDALDTIERLVVREWVTPQHVLVDAFSARAQYQK